MFDGKNIKSVLDWARNKWGSQVTCSINQDYIAGHNPDSVELSQWFTIGKYVNGEIHIMGEGASWTSAIMEAVKYENKIKVLAKQRTTKQR